MSDINNIIPKFKLWNLTEERRLIEENKRDIKLAMIVGDSRLKIFKEEFPSISEYLLMYFVIDEENDEYYFDFEKNDNVFSHSLDGGLHEHVCHVTTHIGENLEWAKNKIKAKKAQLRGDETIRNGTYTPTWFDSTESASQIFEYLLKSLRDEKIYPILKQIEKWVSNIESNYNDYNNFQFEFQIEMNCVTGHGIAANTDYSNRFECHGVNFVLEYPVSHSDGPFVFYTAYPYYTDKDNKVIEIARRKWYKKKHTK